MSAVAAVRDRLSPPPPWEEGAQPAASELELSIVIPCLNEAETIGICVLKATGFLNRHGIAGEVVVADNGSTDGSKAIVRVLGARLVDVAIRGYGAALQAGIAAARGRYVIVGDADDSYDFANLMPFVISLRAGRALVVGNRFKGGIAPGAMPFLHRYLGNPVLSSVGRLFFKSRVGDFHCGLRGFAREAIVGLDLQTTGMEFASEMIVRASLAGLAIAEVPTTLSKDGRSRPPHLNTWRDGWRHLRFLLLYSPRWLFLYPGFALVMIGLFTSVLLLPGPLAIANRLTLDIHTMLVACACLVVGVQSVCFALLAQQYAMARKILPPSSRYQPLLTFFTLERMVILGGGIFLAGLAGIGATFATWKDLNFGDLGYTTELRQMMISVTGLAVGVQLMLSGFLSGVIAIGLRD
jgi:glycosyltransferase involved in cell wall biosynthesis